MNLFPFFLYSAGFRSYKTFYGRKTMQLGIKSKDYYFALTIGLLIFSPFLFLITPFTLSSFSVLVIGLILITAINRAVGLMSFTEGLKNITPMEMNSFVSITVLVTYVIDVLTKTSAFHYISVAVLLLVLIGCFIISNGSIGFQKAKFELFAKIVTDVFAAYLNHYALNYMNAATFVFLISLFSTIMILPFIKQFGVTKKGLKRGLSINVFGTLNFWSVTLVAGISPTLYILLSPLAMTITILATALFTKKEHYTKKQYLGSVITLIGILAFSLIQLFT